MKTYRNLWAEFISDENIKLAIENFSKGKKKRNKIKKILANEEKYIPIIREYAINFTPPKHTPKEIYDGISRKKRTIVIPTTMECIIHHMIVQVLKPMFMKSMYEHSYGSVPGRGGTYGKKCIKKWIKRGGKNIKYVYKLDVKHFYENISQDILIERLKAKIKDFRFMCVLEKVIRTTDKGLPLGFYTSVWLANWYLTELDHKIKSCGIKLYFARYVDDMTIFCSSKKKLRIIKSMIEAELRKLKLTVKHDWQIFRFHYLKAGSSKIHGRAVDFMGFKFYRNKITLRKSILKKIRAKAFKIWKKSKTTLHDAKQMLSALGWLKHCDIYGYYMKWIKPFIDFGKMKRIVSTADRKGRGIRYDRIQISREYAVGIAA